MDRDLKYNTEHYEAYCSYAVRKPRDIKCRNRENVREERAHASFAVYNFVIGRGAWGGSQEEPEQDID